MYDKCSLTRMTDAGTDFEVVAFFPADHASVADNKLYVNGGVWDRLAFPAYPQAVPTLALVAAIRVPYRAHHQDHTFEMLLEDADGNPLSFRVEGQFRFGTEPQKRVGDPSMMTVAVPVTGVVLEKTGDYAFVLKLDGSEVARYLLQAVQAVVAGPMIIPPGWSAAQPPVEDG